MENELTVHDVDALTVRLDFDVRTQAMVHHAQLSAYTLYGLSASSAIVSAHRSTILSRALVDGRIPGVGVGSVMSVDGRNFSDFVYGMPIQLPNGRVIPFFLGAYRLRGNVTASFWVSDGTIHIDYRE